MLTLLTWHDFLCCHCCCCCCCVLVQLPAASAPDLVASVLLHIEPHLSSLQPKQLPQLVWALRQLQHTPPQVISFLFDACFNFLHPASTLQSFSFVTAIPARHLQLELPLHGGDCSITDTGKL